MSGEAVSVALALIAVAVSVFALRTARGARVAAAATPGPARFSVRVMDGEADRVVADDTRDTARDVERDVKRDLDRDNRR